MFQWAEDQRGWGPVRCVMGRGSREREGGSDHGILFQQTGKDSSMKDTNCFLCFFFKRKSDPA